jgi:hypothetical protein
MPARRRRTSDDLPFHRGTAAHPNNFGKQWRTVRQDLSVPEVTTHSFRNTVATLIDDEACRRASEPTTLATPTSR